MTTTIFFDLGNVIIDVYKQPAIDFFTQRSSLDRDMISRAADSQLEIDFEIGRISAAEYLNRLKQQFLLHNHLTLDDLVNAWRSFFVLNRELWSLVQQLKSRFRLYILSNTNPLHIRAIEEKYDLLKTFHGHIFSYELGLHKPDPRIYEQALAIAQAAASQTLFIDDLAENVTAAQELGITTHQYRNVAGLINFLKDHQLI